MNPKHEWFKLNRTLLFVLFIYYMLLLLISAYLLFARLYFIETVNTTTLFKETINLSMISSLAGATIFYIRKLYKACINLDIVEPLSPEDRIRQVGVFFYFFLRPAFSIVLSLVTIILIKSGIVLLTENSNIKSEFLLFSSVISFFVGFSCGDYIDKLEVFGKNIVNKVAAINNQ